MNLPGIANGVTNRGVYAPENLIAGEYPRVMRVVTVTGGASLIPGAVLGRMTADGRYQLSDAAAADGSEIPDAILAEPVDATLGDVEAHVYLAGEFNELALQLGPRHTLASVRGAFRVRSLFLRPNHP